MLGLVRDVRAVLSAADIHAMPSRWEGFGLSAAEAMAAGLPVVATDVGGLREVVADGETGLLVRPGDPFALAEAIETLARDADLRRRLGEAGRRRVARKYPVDAGVAAHERLYLRLAGGRRGS